MVVLKLLACLVAFCAFFADAKILEKIDAEEATVEDLVRKEFNRFASIQDVLEEANLNMTLVLWHLSVDENGTDTQLDSIEFMSHTSDPQGPQVVSKMEQENANYIFEFARKLDMTAVTSHEKYFPDGSLSYRDVFVEDVTIHYENGNSRVVFEDTEDVMSKDETAFENYLKIVTDYELPVEVTMETYDEEGNIASTNTTKYQPRKVTILEVDAMSVSMQMKVAEALKRAFVMKHSHKDRMDIICRFLKAQFGKYSWQASVGDGELYVVEDVSIKLELDGDVYTIWGIEW